ncbi:uncharacterized protein Gasu_49090 [Galdieria sulphuraria]|uniref:Uncharacterized protein n=1 Tax=Galdieria sulphuraria TaxID=130081 RepID=M2XCF9_GALSU|nr:uncharacterized protein Gasu_49090 [Galdieria sulphuraria]EME27617.1 hypothetical protein Gasu_49090 [Galdieria sulphuraria]|eukprot:XP_005704137.1 hypothetical protein Gasu_49090 [Galdieria sulphuraria]
MNRHLRTDNSRIFFLRVLHGWPIAGYYLTTSTNTATFTSIEKPRFSRVWLLPKTSVETQRHAELKLLQGV